jgi:hypothetical protein
LSIRSSFRYFTAREEARNLIVFYEISIGE